MKGIVSSLLVWMLTAVCAQAGGDRIWAALVLATKETPAKAPPKELARLAPVLEDVFGYNTFYLLGQKKRELASGGEEWLIPSREFFFRVQCLERGATAYSLRIQLFRDQKLLVTTEARLARGAPLYIRGPAWGRGHLIFLLEVL